MHLLDKTLFYVSAGIRANPDIELNEIEKALFRLQQQTLKESGCRQFEIMQDKDDRSRFTLWEAWVDEAALEAHYAAEHTQAYFEKDYTRIEYVEKLRALNVASDVLS